MKKISLIVTLLIAVLLLQKCKKDTESASAMSSTLLFAVINDTTWNADTVNATVTYNSATKSKMLTCSAIGNNKEVNMSVTQTVNALNTAGFPLNTVFNADAIGTNLFSYYTAQKNSSGVFVLTPLGTVAPGSGTLNISAIDSVKKVITGTFSMTAIKDNYDSNGVYISTTVSQVNAGAFNNMPYTFISK